MNIGGLQKFSLLDYPGYLAAIVFTQGCNFRCPFCYNPMLVRPLKADKLKDNNSSHQGKSEKDYSYTRLQRYAQYCGQVSEDDLFLFLKARQGKLDGIVITGGEPTIQADLVKFCERVKSFSFLIKLDTNGTNPEMLKELINKKLIDYIAMDIKAPENKYKKVSGVTINFKNIKKSVKIIIESKLPYEFRTTVTPGLLDKDDIAQIGELIKDAKSWYLQKFRGGKDLVDKKYQGVKAYTDKEMREMQVIGRQYVKKCEIR